MSDAQCTADPAAAFRPHFPPILSSVFTILEQVDVTIEEFRARRNEVYLSYEPDRSPTDRFLAAVHEFVIAEYLLEYWFGTQFANMEHRNEAAYGRIERAANAALRRYEKAHAALERHERARDRERRDREKALAALAEAREKRAFTLARDERRYFESRAVRIEKQKERAERDYANRLERQRRDAERAAEKRAQRESRAAAQPASPATLIPEAAASNPVPWDREAPTSTSLDAISKGRRQLAGAEPQDANSLILPSADYAAQTAKLAEHHELAADSAELPSLTSVLHSIPANYAPAPGRRLEKKPARRRRHRSLRPPGAISG